MTQREIILTELKKREWFSLGDALNLDPPIYAVSQRIGELKKQGYDIESERVPGHPYFRYRLRGQECGYPIHAGVSWCVEKKPCPWHKDLPSTEETMKHAQTTATDERKCKFEWCAYSQQEHAHWADDPRCVITVPNPTINSQQAAIHTTSISSTTHFPSEPKADNKQQALF